MTIRAIPQFDGLNVSIENEDWVALEGTPSDLEQLGRIFLELAQSGDHKCVILDASPPHSGQGVWA